MVWYILLYTEIKIFNIRSVIKIVFSNLLFMFAFLPANIILYFLARNFKVKNIILIIFSLVFYAWGEPVCVALLIFSSFIGYIFAMQIHKSETEQQKKCI